MKYTTSLANLRMEREIMVSGWVVKKLRAEGFLKDKEIPISLILKLCGHEQALNAVYSMYGCDVIFAKFVAEILSWQTPSALVKDEAEKALIAVNQYLRGEISISEMKKYQPEYRYVQNADDAALESVRHLIRGLSPSFCFDSPTKTTPITWVRDHDMYNALYEALKRMSPQKIQLFVKKFAEILDNTDVLPVEYSDVGLYKPAKM